MVDVPPEESSWIHEIKFDGYRLQAHLQNGKIKLFTRGGHDWTKQFPNLTEALIKQDVESAIFDGEAVIVDKSGRSDFGLLQNALSIKDYTNMRLYLFDLLYLNGEDLRERPLKERKELLLKILAKSSAPLFYSEEVRESGARFFKMACKHKLEGIVSKDLEAPYKSKRTRAWCKSKCGHRQEFVIGGFTFGKGGREKTLGALLLGVYEGVKEERKLRYVGKVGTGFDYRTMGELLKKLLPLEKKKSPFDKKSPTEKGIHWINPKLMAEVNFSEWTKDQILRAPVYIGLRRDKKALDIVIERPVHMDVLENEDVVLTHPEKVLYPKEKITKKMIADYYDLVSALMLPYLTQRPLSLLRCPHGGVGKCFFQKHPGAEGVPKNFTSFKVSEKSGSSEYLCLNNKDGLKQVVQMNAYELHTWNCRYQNLLNPDQIVMDFDPAADVGFPEVVNACYEMKKILDKLKLKSFVKVTGGKGIHIHIPVEPIYSWEEIKAFSKALAEEMVSRKPKEYIATMSKVARKGKIFIDYLRNGFGSTAVAPYSLRAKELSSVALPVEWNELKRLMSADQFTLKKALQKIKNRKKDPWRNFFSLKQKISILEESKITE